MPVFRRARRSSAPEVERRVRAALDDMRALLRNESFAVELIRFDAKTRTAHLRIGGGCPDCDMTPATLMDGIEAHLKRAVPEIAAVEAKLPQNN